MAWSWKLSAVLVVLCAATSASPVVPAAPAAAEQVDEVDERGDEVYVVTFSGDADAVDTAVQDAGGDVLDVNAELDVALVQSDRGDEFVDDITANDAVTGVAQNHAVGVDRPGLPHRFADERPGAAERAAAEPPAAEPLASSQWNMAMLDAEQANATVTGEGVDVGIIDTGVDASHPDIAPNFDLIRSRNFTVDLPSIDGPCESLTCVDGVGADDRGHGTHVAGVVAAARNGFGVSGVAPDATLVNLRAGQDSGYFFLYETVAAITEAGHQRLDVVNMSFYTDPWLYKCASRDDYVNGEVSDEEIAQQVLARDLITQALEYAHDQGVTLVAAAGNEHTDMSVPWRPDAVSPGFPPGAARPRVVRDTCLDLPLEGPHVLGVSSVGPSGAKADYSNYGHGNIHLSAPGGWLRDHAGTPEYKRPENLILSTYPQAAAIGQQLAGDDGQPVDPFSVRHCDAAGQCGFYTYLQGTSMASPHVAGVAALVVQRHGAGSAEAGFALAPDRVAEVLASTASDRPCPDGGVQSYDAAGRPTTWNARCEGSPEVNGFYGEGVVNAAAAVE